MILVYPGSFDPVTNGHISLIKRGLTMCDKMIVAVLNNSSKRSLFTPEERMVFLCEALADEPKVEVDSFSGLLIDYAEKVEANGILRGLRAVSDFEYEMQMALANKGQDSTLETLFMVSNTEYSYLSSSIVKEIAQYQGDVSQWVPECVNQALIEKFRRR